MGGAEGGAEYVFHNSTVLDPSFMPVSTNVLSVSDYVGNTVFNIPITVNLASSSSRISIAVNPSVLSGCSSISVCFELPSSFTTFSLWYFLITKMSWRWLTTKSMCKYTK